MKIQSCVQTSSELLSAIIDNASNLPTSGIEAVLEVAKGMSFTRRELLNASRDWISEAEDAPQ